MSETLDKIGYDAAEYSKVKSHGWRVWVETHTIWNLFREVMDMKGKKILDAGCGTGLHARHMVEYLGAAHVLGVDGDAGFVRQATDESAAFGDTVAFRQAWIQNSGGVGDCDGALASYLMSYPQDLDQATAFTQGMADHIKTGAPIVGFANNHRQRTGGAQYAKYGFTKKHVDTDFDGAPVEWRIDGLTDPITNYNLQEHTFLRAFEAAGLGAAFSRVQLNPAQAANPHWHEFMADEPPVIAFLAIKGETHARVQELLRTAELL